MAIALRERLGLDGDALPVRVLMGGETAADWRERPEAEKIVIGTIDKLRNPGLTIDEVQLMGPARVTSAQLRLELLHSCFRAPERDSRLQAALDSELPADGRIVVSTQVIEAGVDVSSALLASETAPFSSLVQRLGRCNRSAEHPEARFRWLDLGDPRRAAGSMAPPYDPADLEASRTALFGLVGSSVRTTTCVGPPVALGPTQAGELTLAILENRYYRPM